MCHCLNYPLISGRGSENLILSFLDLFHVYIMLNDFLHVYSKTKSMPLWWLNYWTSLASQTTGAWLLPLRWRQPGDVANCSCQRCKQSQYYSPQRCSDWTHQSRCTGNRYKNIYLSTQWLKSKYSKKNSLLLVIITIKNWQHEIVFFFYKCT